ncbi:hypothetical protein [Polymorphobacter megasporae]|uniref:hypothetical protein n=1 Tax=Glacieibacterium megasporae TaxID=2835787 RepID=UPI001C1E638E|nr:hypothetical protein [Polymorphobacter megasporae]UAJ10645.1 hypothetical protein KTC28_02495 [Polymorphobacter megasporae]
MTRRAVIVEHVGDVSNVLRFPVGSSVLLPSVPCDPSRSVEIIRTGIPDVPVVVIVDGKPRIDLSDAISEYATENFDTFVSSMRASFMALLKVPGFFLPCGKLVITAGVSKARAFAERLVKDMDGSIKNLKGGRPGKSILLSDEFHSIGEKLFRAMAALMTMLRRGGITDCPNWTELQGSSDLTEAQRALISAQSHQNNPAIKPYMRRDTLRYYRFPARLWIPARTQDVRWASEVMKALKDAPLAVFLHVLIQATSGCRPGEPQWITFWDLLKGEEFGGVLLRNKHQGTIAAKKGALGPALLEMCSKYVDTVRLGLEPGRDMAYFRRLASLATRGSTSTKDRRAAIVELKSTPILLNQNGDRLRYKSVWRECRKLFGDIPATLHWLRHEFVFNRLREIEKIPDQRLQNLHRRHLVLYMGWRSEEQMLACYDAYHRQRMILETTLAHIATVDFGISRILSNDDADRPAISPTPRTAGAHSPSLEAFLLEAA